MKAGETERFDCDECLIEFEVTLEPKAKGSKELSEAVATVTVCPFCGEELETDDDDGEEAEAA